MLRRLFLPWSSRDDFDEEASFFAFLRKKNRRMNTERIVLFAAAFLGLMFTYATDQRIGNYVAVGALAIALVLSLMIGKNEKVLSAGEKSQ